MTPLKRLLSFLVMVMMLVTVIGCSNQASGTKNVGAIIESNLDTIVSEKSIAMSSNPGDYISKNKQAYREIVDLGQPALQYLTDKLEQESENGLRQWIMAKACSELLGTKDPVTNWASGKEWYQKYCDQK
jgi:hypothetical protein